jgi:hypothetical protein
MGDIRSDYEALNRKPEVNSQCKMDLIKDRVGACGQDSSSME